MAEKETENKNDVVSQEIEQLRKENADYKYCIEKMTKKMEELYAKIGELEQKLNTKPESKSKHWLDF